jgi:hypothetical protein
MKKRYKLLKQTPRTNAGVIFSMFYFIEGGSTDSEGFHKNYVEHNPEWFEEIVDGVLSPIEYLRRTPQNDLRLHCITLYSENRCIDAVNAGMNDAWNAALDTLWENKDNNSLHVLIANLKKSKDFKF